MTLAEATEAFAAYRNGLGRARQEMDADEFALYEADLAKARAAMEVAWLAQVVA